MNPQEIIHNALNNIQTKANIYGTWKDNINSKRIDGELKLEIEDQTIHLFADIKTEIRTIHLGKIEELAKEYHPFIVVAQRIFPKIKEELRNRNIAYLEANGNIYLKDKGFFLWIEANSPIEIKDKTTNRAFTKTGLKVVYQFLLNEEWINYTYRQIALETNTGIGNVNNIFTGLKKEGYLLQLNKDQYRLDNKKKLLETWILEYEKRLKPTLTMGTFRFLKEDDFYNWKNLQLQNGKTWWGGEPAGDLFTNYLRPEELTMYTTETRSDLMKNYRLVPDNNGNVKVFKKFWENDEVNYNVVHPLLAYADLINEETEDVPKLRKKYTMSTYKINFKQLRQQPQLSEMLSALERGLNKFDIDFYLVGAVARDLWMSAINDIPPSRITGDIDFAIFINDKGTYGDLKNYLIEVEGFSPYKGNAFVLVWKGFIEVDLLPFGEIEDKNDAVNIEGSGLTSLNMPGFKEIYDDGLPVAELEEIHKFKFCTLPGIVILKLIAWQDRPEIRRDDIKDMSNILKHFFDMYADEIYENHNDLFGDDDLDLHLIAARVMGREMNKIAKRNDILKNRLKNLLEVSTNSKDIEIAKIMVEFYDNTIEDNLLILEHIKTGYLE